MGLKERENIRSARRFVSQLTELRIPTGCVQTVMHAMGARPSLADVIDQYERQTGIPNAAAYLRDHGLELSGYYTLKGTVSISEMRRRLRFPKVALAEQDYAMAHKQIAGILFHLGPQDDGIPHVIGVIPSHFMPRDLRRKFHREDRHLVVDTSLAGEPVYSMTTRNIVENVNAFILNNIDIALSIVTRRNRT